jgi:hypothetical protein
MFGQPIKYSDFYKEDIPKNPIDLIKGIPKEEVLATIAAINSRLKPVNSVYFDDSLETQVDCIRVIFLDYENHPSQSNCIKFINKFLKTPPNANLFTRVTCLYSYQEILNSSGFTTIKPEYTVKIREQILKFMLIANEKILLFDKEYNEDDHKVLNQDFFEYFMFKELPHNQYYTSSNSINLFYKSWRLFKTIQIDDFFGDHLEAYLKETFGVETFSDFFRSQMYTYFKSYDEKLKLNYINIRKEEKEALQILNKLSERNHPKLPDETDPKIFDFFDIKKSPLFKNESDEDKEIITFLVLDNILLIEKTYSLFINDFWFDYLKTKNICTRADWGNFIGSNFFEPFLEEIFHNAFKYNRRTIFLSTDDLNISLKGKSEIEFADFLIRDRKNVMLIEAKSNYLPIVNGYKTVKDIEDYKSLNLDKFYKDYGLKQLVSKTIKFYNEYKTSLPDSSFDYRKKVKLHPAIIANDPIFSSGYALFAFRRKFESLLKQEAIPQDDINYKIMPLAIINVSDLQDVEQSLKNGSENIFNILRHYYSISNEGRITAEDSSAVLNTVSHSINALIKNNLIANRIITLKWLGLN